MKTAKKGYVTKGLFSELINAYSKNAMYLDKFSLTLSNFHQIQNYSYETEMIAFTLTKHTNTIARIPWSIFSYTYIYIYIHGPFNERDFTATSNSC